MLDNKPNPDLSGKANLDASNLSSTNIGSWQQKLITSAIAGEGIVISNGKIATQSSLEKLAHIYSPSNGKATVSNISSYKYLLFLAYQSNNGYFGTYLPTSIFKSLMTSTQNKVILTTDSTYFTFYYVNDTSIHIQDVGSTISQFIIYGEK